MRSPSPCARPRARCRAGSEIISTGVQLRGERAAGRLLGGDPSLRGPSFFSLQPGRPAGRQLGWVGAQDRRGPSGRLVPATAGVDDDLIGAGRRQPGAQWLARRHLAEAQDQVGHDRPGEALVPQQQVVGGDDMGTVVGPAAQLRGRLGEDRKAGDAGEVGERLAQLGVELAAGDDDSGDGVADVSGDLVQQEGRGLEVDLRHRSQRPPVATIQRQRVGRGHRPLGGNRRKRLAPGEVEVNRAGPRLAAGRRERAAGDRAVVQEPVVIRRVGSDFAEPAHRGPVELKLVDRLPGADPAQLRRTVGGERDQRHRRFVGLADRRVEVGGRGPGGAEHRHRDACRLRRSKGEERRGALVNDHGHVDLRLAPERHRERRGAGAGGEDGVTEPAAGQLLGEGRGKGGVGIGRVHWVGALIGQGHESAVDVRAGALATRPRRSRPRDRGQWEGGSSRRATRTRPRRWWR